MEKSHLKALKIENEILRIAEMSAFEKECYQIGYNYIAGVDEVGRGPLAGPVVTAAVILPPDCFISGINDSKKLSEAKRKKLFEEIKYKAVSINIGICDNKIIDEINILQATKQAMVAAINGLNVKPDFLLIDALELPISLPQKGIVKGDTKSISIAAASIIAKVTRDRMMVEYASIYPEYSFEKHKGYGTKIHYEAIKKFGLTDIHRRSFTKGYY